MMGSDLWLMYGPWTLLLNLINGVSWNLKGRVHLHACMQLLVLVLMVFFCFVEEGMQIVCHWQVHIDLLNIGMVVGNGLLLLVFSILRDINMQLFLLMHDFMCLEVHLVVEEW